jgi:hypothetical protein
MALPCPRSHSLKFQLVRQMPGMLQACIFGLGELRGTKHARWLAKGSAEKTYKEAASRFQYVTTALRSLTMTASSLGSSTYASSRVFSSDRSILAS